METAIDEAKLQEFLVQPPHDTGSIWYVVLSFLLPILGLVGMLLFKKFRHIRNYKQCRKGTIAGFVMLGIILAVFLVLFAFVVI